MKRSLLSLLNLDKAWGVSPIRASPATPQGRTLEVYRRGQDEPVLVGHLSHEGNEFVFKYGSDYVGRPISAFPNRDKEYRSKHLWPFFAIRIPPLKREDVRNEIARHSLSDGQVIEILGHIGKASVANPYEFRLQ